MAFFLSFIVFPLLFLRDAESSRLLGNLGCLFVVHKMMFLFSYE